MSVATNLTLTAIVALAGRLTEAHRALKAGRPEAALPALTEVIDSGEGPRELAWAARLLRSRAHRAREDRKAALEDLQWLATRDLAPAVRRQAREEYLAAGGDPKGLVPPDPPTVVWKRIQKWIGSDQADRLSSCLTPAYLRSLEHLRRMLGEDGIPPLADMLDQEEAELVEQSVDEAGGTARLLFRDEEMLYTVFWVQDGLRWLIADIEGRPAEGPSVPDPAHAVGGSMRADDAEPYAEASPALRAEIESLIRQLGASDPPARATARKRLREIGAPARPFLQARLRDPDPEIAESARELLEGP